MNSEFILSTAIFGILFSLYAIYRSNQTSKRLDSILGSQKSGKKNLESAIREYRGIVDQHSKSIENLIDKTDILEKYSLLSFQRYGLVRFNPFRDTGGDQSFALALLDKANSGIIITAVHARDGTRIYAKSISEGKSTGALSKEEEASLKQALESPRPHN